MEKFFLNTSVQAPFAELDQSCPSLLSWHLIRGSTIAAIVLLAFGLLLVVLPAVVLFVSCVKKHFVVQTVPFASFGEQEAPPPADYCSSRNQSYGVRRTGGIDDSPLIGLGRRLTDSGNASPNVGNERSIVSSNNWSPLLAGGRAGQHNIRDYGDGRNVVLSDEEFQDCTASGIDQPADSPLDRCRLILKSEPEDDGLGNE